MGTYKTSTIRLYQATPSSNWELLPHKLFIVDDIESYLATKTFNTYTLVQYQKPTLELSIVLDLSQTYAEPLNSGFKYARIENSDDTGHYYYYFVKSIDWRAKSAVRFNLVMDVLNTFKEGTHYTFKDSTKISREHKDRFVIKNLEVTIYYEYAGGSGVLSIGDTVTVEDDQGTAIIHGKLTDYDQDYVILEDDTGHTIQEIKDLFENAEPPFILKKDNATYVEMILDSYEFSNGGVYRNIDYVPENINPTLQCGSSEGVFIENSKTLLQCDWYLLYRNENDPDPNEYVNPVECYLIPEEDIEVDAGIINAGRLTATSLQMTYWYAIGLGDKGYTASTNVTITLDNGVVLSPSVSTNDQRNVIIKRNDDNTMTVYVVYGEVAQNTGTSTKFEGSWQCEYLTFSAMPVTLRYGLTEPTGRSYDIRDKITGGAWLEGLLPLSNSTNPAYIDGVNKLDKTDSRNIKLIKLPYAPYNFTITSNKLVISSDSKWDYIKLTQADSSVIYALKLNNLNTKLNAELNASSSSYHSLRNLYRGALSVVNPQNNDLRSSDTYFNNESKLFNSEFYRPTYVYDSFSYTVQLEKCELSYYITNGVQYFYIDFDMTRTINSKFMFTFKSLSFRNATESYAKYMPIARNNEEVLYNVPYINYIRSGYNYDIKAKNRSTFNAWASVGATGLGIAASLALPTAPMKALGIVTSLISLAMTTKNAISTTMQNEENMSRKLKEAEMQTASVSGSDDVDLMSIYADNRLKYLIYQPTAIMKTMLNNLFFFAGYNSQRMGLPSHNTRLNFDYLECDAVINKIANIPDDCLTELVNAFKYGVTYIHKTSRTTDKWDFDQKYENWEKSLGVE